MSNFRMNYSEIYVDFKLKDFIEHAFEKLNLPDVVADIYSENVCLTSYNEYDDKNKLHTKWRLTWKNDILNDMDKVVNDALPMPLQDYDRIKTNGYGVAFILLKFLNHTFTAGKLEQLKGENWIECEVDDPFKENVNHKADSLEQAIDNCIEDIYAFDEYKKAFQNWKPSCYKGIIK